MPKQPYSDEFKRDAMALTPVKSAETLLGRRFIRITAVSYTSGLFTTRCLELGVTQSMGAVGTSADNALAESFNATIKREVLQHRKTFTNQEECRREVLSWCVRVQY